MKGNVKLYHRVVEEKRLGSKVLGDDYDAVTTEEFPRASIAEGKVFHLKGHKRKGLRTVKNESKEEVVPLVFTRRPDDAGKTIEEIQSERMGKWFQRRAGTGGGDSGGSTGSPAIHLHSGSEERPGGIRHGGEGPPEVIPATRYVVDCPKCGNHDHVQRNAMHGTYYCTVHPRAIMESLLA